MKTIVANIINNVDKLNGALNSRLLIDNPEVWQFYAREDCSICKGTGEEDGQYGCPGRMCECMEINFPKAIEDGWLLED